MNSSSTGSLTRPPPRMASHPPTNPPTSCRLWISAPPLWTRSPRMSSPSRPQTPPSGYAGMTAGTLPSRCRIPVPTPTRRSARGKSSVSATCPPWPREASSRKSSGTPAVPSTTTSACSSRPTRATPSDQAHGRKPLNPASPASWTRRPCPTPSSGRPTAPSPSAPLSGANASVATRIRPPSHPSWAGPSTACSSTATACPSSPGRTWSCPRSGSSSTSS